jgi:YggT family protein
MGITELQGPRLRGDDGNERYFMAHPIVFLVITLLDILQLLVFVWVVLQMLISFKIVNGMQTLVRQVMYYLNRLLLPLVRPIRKYVPDVGGLDLSPLILLIAIWFVRYCIVYYV